VQLELSRVSHDDGGRYQLSDLEARVLRYLAVNGGRPVARRELLQRVMVVDAEAVDQILGNLVDNAAKYANGTSPPTIQVAGKAANGSLVLTVLDHGPGIAREQAAAIFEPFERGGRDPSDPVPGVGLGLALARGLARELGGELTLESPTDGGARFRLELPATTWRNTHSAD
jgi:signal transduction histidine kinase